MKKLKMGESLRIFGLLLHKSFLVRKRHWLFTLIFQILVPIILFLVMVMCARDSYSYEGVRYPSVQYNETHFVPVDPLTSRIDTQFETLFYAPRSPQIDRIINETMMCLKISSEQVRGSNTEDEMVADYIRYRAEISRSDIAPKSVMYGIVFHKTRDTKTWRYTIRPAVKLPTDLYKTAGSRDVDPNLRFFEFPFTNIQWCVDNSIIEQIAQLKNSPKIHVSLQKMPTPPRVRTEERSFLIYEVLPSIIIVALSIPFLIEALYPLQERASGIKRLFRVNAVSNIPNLFSWLISGLVITLFCTVIILIIGQLLIEYRSVSCWSYTFIFWSFVVIHILHLTAFSLHLSAYFIKPGLLIVAWSFFYFGAAILHNYLWLKNYHNTLPYLGIVFPDIMLRRALEEFHGYIDLYTTTNFSNWFESSSENYTITGSVGFILLFSLLGTIIHFVLAVCAYQIRPSEWKAASKRFFTCRRLRNAQFTYESNVDNCDYSPDKTNFETSEEEIPAAIKISNLVKTYLNNGVRLDGLKGISMDIYKGQITTVLGYSGSGKSTLVSLLTGTVEPTEGSISVNGQELGENLRDVRRNINVCHQDNLLFPSLSVLQQVKFFGKLKSKGVSSRKIHEDALNLLGELSLLEKKNCLPQSLSYSEKRRLCLAMALIGDSETVILDSPTAGMDSETKRAAWNVLLKIKDKTILVMTSDIEETEVLGDRIAVMKCGKIRTYGTTDFFNKQYGFGTLQVTLATDESSDPEKIAKEFTEDTQVISATPGQVILHVENNELFPASIDNVRAKKESLGITAINVSLVTLKQVYSKSTAEEELAAREMDFEPFETSKKSNGCSLSVEKFWALWAKKSTFTRKNYFIFLVILLLPLIPIISLAVHDDYEGDRYSLKLSEYGSTRAFYIDHNNTMISAGFRKAIERYGGEITAPPKKYTQYSYHKNRINQYPSQRNVGFFQNNYNYRYPGSNDPMNRYPGTNDPMNRYPGMNDPMNRYPGINDPMNRYPGSNDPMNRYPSMNDPMNRYPGSNDPMNRYPVSNDPMNRYPGMNDPMNRYPGINDPSNRYPGSAYDRFPEYNSYDRSFSNYYPDSRYGGYYNYYNIPSYYSLSELSHALLDFAREYPEEYHQHTIVSAEFKDTAYYPYPVPNVKNINVTVFYSGHAARSVPTAMNVLSNALLINLASEDYQIETNYQQLPDILTSNYYEPRIKNLLVLLWKESPRALFLCLFVFIAVALFAIHPVRETASKLKNLQRMSGVSSGMYWTVMFLVDVLIFLILIAIIVAFVFLCDFIADIRIFYPLEVFIFTALLILFAFNVLPFIYIVTFFRKTVYSAIFFLCAIPIGLVFLQHVMELYVTSRHSSWLYWFERAIFLIFPYVSFFQGQRSFYTTALKNARCRKYSDIWYSSCGSYDKEPCCKLNCKDGYCEDNIPYFKATYQGLYSYTYQNNNYELLSAMLFLCFTPFLYFGILALLESNLLRFMRSSFSFDRENNSCVKAMRYLGTAVSYPKSHNSAADNDTRSTQQNLFLAHELSQKHRKSKGAKVTFFLINQGECLGIYNIDQSGKEAVYTATAFSQDKDPNVCLNTGYCPDSDVMLNSLNAYDHLRLFARLRGIPGESVDSEAAKWISRLNLEGPTHATRNYSATQKRKLNLAMALIGNPTLVLLDEPTAKLDPMNKELLWSTLKNCQTEKQSVIITSQSIEECETLCNRLATMDKDQLVSVTVSDEQKEQFESGYEVIVKLNQESNEEEINAIKESFDSDLECDLIDENPSFLNFHIGNSKVTWKRMYVAVNRIKTKFQSVEDFIILSASLKQLFVHSTKCGDGSKHCTVVKINPSNVFKNNVHV